MTIDYCFNDMTIDYCYDDNRLLLRILRIHLNFGKLDECGPQGARPREKYCFRLQERNPMTWCNPSMPSAKDFSTYVRERNF